MVAGFPVEWYESSIWLPQLHVPDSSAPAFKKMQPPCTLTGSTGMLLLAEYQTVCDHNDVVSCIHFGFVLRFGAALVRIIRHCISMHIRTSDAHV